jgi:hypothetical protein
MKNFLLALMLAGLTAGCGTLIPKRVEFGQDKVRVMPEPTDREKEILRRAAALAAEKARETREAAVTNDSPPAVTVPAHAAEVLTEAVSESLGPPKHDPAGEDPQKLAADLRAALAKLNARLESFRGKNDENVGKKIEGTGFLQIPYFVWLLMVVAVGFVGLILLGIGWSFLKMFAMSNPPVALGVGAVQMGGKLTARAVSQLIKGGEEFKKALGGVVSDPKTLKKVRELFTGSHRAAQDEQLQGVVKELTK